MVILGELISGYLNLNEVQLWFGFSDSESQTKKTQKKYHTCTVQLRWITKYHLFEEKTKAHLNKSPFPKTIWISVTQHSMITSKKSILNYRGFKSIKKKYKVLTNYQWIQNCLTEAKENNGNKEYSWRNINGQDLVQLFKIEILFTWWNICKQYASTQQVCPSPQFLLC
jgi:hypothetical protein